MSLSHYESDYEPSVLIFLYLLTYTIGLTRNTFKKALPINFIKISRTLTDIHICIISSQPGRPPDQPVNREDKNNYIEYIGTGTKRGPISQIFKIKLREVYLRKHVDLIS